MVHVTRIELRKKRILDEGGGRLYSLRSWICFFFQAEDGIRDYKVTGVQTCALPISIGHFVSEAELRKHDTEKMTNLVRRFASLTIICPKTGMRRGECWAESMRLTSSDRKSVV